MKSTFKDFEYKFVQEHEFLTLHNQEILLEDLDRFSEIFHRIRDLQRNVLDIEVTIFAEDYARVEHKLKRNANLCYTVYTAVKQLQTELDKPDVGEGDDLVSRARSVQLDCLKTIYIKAYWRYWGVIRRYEEKLTRFKSVSSLVEDEDPSERGPSETLLEEIQLHQFPPGDCHTTQPQTVEEALHTLASLEGRHQELLALERSLVEMRDLFVLFSTLIMDHGSILQLAEGNVEIASAHVANAVQRLQAARRCQWRVAKRKFFCCYQMGMMLFVLAVLVIILVVLLVEQFVF
ncbi:syntaxin-1A-like isoform X2 [Toxorhynchites rutilus septentrionalis]|uniref:syntaxin-1A-like isoform X2 n=1 Tax=Toxorhynchites rutilus septentrionalis TaxID=329112 RepID=UPI00247A2710|nr:syntaxin-1A-like isoform X2 [Toxorhynchites rutilus septentrionalis]